MNAPSTVQDLLTSFSEQFRCTGLGHNHCSSAVWRRDQSAQGYANNTHNSAVKVKCCSTVPVSPAEANFKKGGQQGLMGNSCTQPESSSSREDTQLSIQSALAAFP